MSKQFILDLRKDGIPVKDNGMCDCPKCSGNGWIEDWDYYMDSRACKVCNTKGEITPRTYRRIKECQIRNFY